MCFKLTTLVLLLMAIAAGTANHGEPPAPGPATVVVVAPPAVVITARNEFRPLLEGDNFVKIRRRRTVSQSSSRSDVSQAVQTNVDVNQNPNQQVSDPITVSNPSSTSLTACQR